MLNILLRSESFTEITEEEVKQQIILHNNKQFVPAGRENFGSGASLFKNST